MLNKLLFISLVVLVFILGILSVREYDRYKVVQAEKRAAETAQVEAERKATSAAKDQKISDLLAEVDYLNKQCEKGASAFELLSTSLKADTEAPICNLDPVVEIAE